MHIRFITTGGTIDKIEFEFDIVPLLQKDSLEMTDEDRAHLRDYIENNDGSLYVITHGTDTMPATAEFLQGIAGKTIVLTGALTPARFRTTDAVFNVGMAVATVQVAHPGVYIAMSGQVFGAGAVRKNRAENRFESLE